MPDVRAGAGAGDEAVIVCELCGRKGTRGFTLLRGQGAQYGYPSRNDQWRCANQNACASRQWAIYRREAREAQYQGTCCSGLLDWHGEHSDDCLARLLGVMS